MLPSFGPSRDGPQLAFVRELEAFDGPILSEYHAANGSGIYLEKWCARDGVITRSLFVRSERRAIAEYMACRVPLLDLLRGNDDVGFIVDREGAEVKAVFLVTVSSLPPNYLPKSMALHDESLRPTWSIIPQDFLIDTEWDARLLSAVETAFMNAYGFAYFTERGKHRKLPNDLFNLNYDGGFLIMHANNSIRAAVPKEDRARSVGVSAGSPGILTIDAPASIAEVLSKSLKALPTAATFYAVLHEWCRFSPQKVARQPTMIPSYEKAVKDVEHLCGALGVDSEPLFPNKPTDQTSQALTALVAGKLIAAHYRRLWRLLETDSGFEFIGARPATVNVPDDVYEEDGDEDDAL